MLFYGLLILLFVNIVLLVIFMITTRKYLPAFYILGFFIVVIYITLGTFKAIDVDFTFLYIDNFIILISQIYVIKTIVKMNRK